jgi:hypothetical protein
MRQRGNRQVAFLNQPDLGEYMIGALVISTWLSARR